MLQLNNFPRYYETLAASHDSFELRPTQVEISALIERAFANNSTAIIEAGTGSGKSIAALLPSINQKDKKTVISTYTINLQEQYINKDLPLLSKFFPNQFTYSVLKGRNNYLGLRRYLDFINENSLDLRITDWVNETQIGDKSELYFTPDYNLWSQINSDSNDCLGSLCNKFKDCFYFNAKQLAQNSDIIVVNHTLLLLDAFANGSILPKYDYLIVDEAHQFSQAAYDVFSLNLSFLGLKQLIAKTNKHLNLNNLVLTKIENLANEFFLRLQDLISQNKLRLKQTPEHTKNLEESLNKLKAQIMMADLECLAVDELMLDKLKLKCKALMAQIDSYTEILQLLLTMPKDYVLFTQLPQTNSYNPKLSAIPLDVSNFIHEKLILKPELKSSVWMSATLNTGEEKPFNYFCQNTGLNRTNYHTLVAESDFNYNEQAILYLPPNLPQVNMDKFINEASHEIIRLLNLSKGKAFVLFTSYNNMNKAYELINAQITYPCQKQNDMPANKLIEWFTNTPNSVLFATSSFWEGVSVDGDSLSLVIIDRIPFKTPGDPHYEAKCDALKQGNEGNWFNDLALPHAIIKLKQGVGRLIRTKQDLGIVAILDNRLTQKSYGKRIIKCLPNMQIIKDFNQLEDSLNKLSIKSS